MPTSTTATWVSRKRSASSLGLLRRIAENCRRPATTAPETKRKARRTCRKRSQSYLDTAARTRIGGMDATERHLRLLTETTEAVISTPDLEEVLSLVASKV